MISQIASLRKLVCDCIKEEVLVAFLSLPPTNALQALEDLAVSTPFSGATLQLVIDRLPGLTRLIPSAFDAECVPLLGRLQMLGEVELCFRWPVTFSSDIAPHLSGFSRLRMLNVHSCAFETDEEVAQFLDAMPLLEELTLDSVQLPPSLAGFAGAKSLSCLMLAWCEAGVTFDTLCQLSACTTLRQLNIIAGDDTDLTDEQQVELGAPSKRLPQLDGFSDC